MAEGQALAGSLTSPSNKRPNWDLTEITRNKELAFARVCICRYNTPAHVVYITSKASGRMYESL